MGGFLGLWIPVTVPVPAVSPARLQPQVVKSPTSTSANVFSETRQVLPSSATST